MTDKLLRPVTSPAVSICPAPDRQLVEWGGWPLASTRRHTMGYAMLICGEEWPEDLPAATVEAAMTEIYDWLD
jgi:hypothetical protein